ncbi:hypothetical protein V4V34_18505 [Lysinibacillus sphaericus]|uniref:hypothetical protein n=1 Tax=Lysinibacillus sphaericus TaxID=1421 RepID=UPI002FBE5EFD
MNQSIIKFFDLYLGTPIYDKNNPDYRCSVKCSDFRLNKAKEQSALKPTNIKDIISYVNELFDILGMKQINNPIVQEPLFVDYEVIKQENELKSTQDIVWMKFTTDGYLGVVATSDDINFNTNNTAGTLIHQLNKKWDQSFVLLFPLINIPIKYGRGDIERAIGNYLIEKNVPIIDFYSHNY